MARLIAAAVGDAKAREEDDLFRAQDSLEAAEEDGGMLEAEVAHLLVERTSLLLELEASKDEVSSRASWISWKIMEEYTKLENQTEQVSRAAVG